MTVRVVQSTRERIRIIEQQNVRVAVAFNGPPGRSGASASVSSDQGNILSVGQDGGIFAGYGAGFLFAQDDGPDQIVGLVDTILRNNSGVVQNKLKLPFNAATLLDANGVFWPRAVDDVYRLIVRVTAAPSVVNTDLTLKLDIGGVFGVIDTIRHRLSLGAGVKGGNICFSAFHRFNICGERWNGSRSS